MKLFCLLLLCTLGTVRGSYKVPAHDPCILEVLLCDNYTVPFTADDNSTLEMFNKVEDLTSVCDKLTRFRVCVTKAEQFCTEIYKSDFGLKLIENRRMAFDLCAPGSAYRELYMMVEGCVNKYSYSARQFCTDKTVKAVGLDFDLENLEQECRYLGAIESCHCAVLTDQCGDIAGNFFKKLLVFRSGVDFICAEYEREKLERLDSFSALINFHVQEYRNLASQTESNRIDELEKDFIAQQEDFEQEKHSFAFDLDYESAFGSKTALYARDQSPHSIVSNNKKFQSTCSSPGANEQSIEQDSCAKNYACQTKNSFLLSHLRNDAVHHLGCGMAHILWATASPLEDIFCSWQMDPQLPSKLFKCSIRVGGQCELVDKSSESEVERSTLFDIVLNVYEANKIGFKKVAKLYVRNFLQTSDGKLGDTVDIFKKQSSDIRYFCSEEQKANLLEEPDQLLSASRIGSMQSDFSQLRMANIQSESPAQKFNFYDPANPKYFEDIEINLISSADGSLESEKFPYGMLQEDYEEVSGPSRNDAMFGKKNLDKPRSRLPKPSHSYRPNAMFRPRLGEKLDAEDSETDSDYLEISAEERDSYLDASEHALEDSCTSHQYAEELCPVLPENISKLINKYRVHPEESYENMADLVDVVESKYYEKFPTSKEIKYTTLRKMIKPIKDTSSNLEMDAEEIYTVTPSAELRPPSGMDDAVSGDITEQTTDEDFNYLGKDSSQEFSEVLDAEDGDLTVEDYTIADPTNPRRVKLEFLELISDDPFSYKFVDASTNRESNFKEELSSRPNSVFQKVKSDSSN